MRINSWPKQIEVEWRGGQCGLEHACVSHQGPIQCFKANHVDHHNLTTNRRCDALILTRQSTFGYTAAGMSGSVPHTVFEHKVERRFHCGPFELCDMTPTELGL